MSQEIVRLLSQRCAALALCCLALAACGGGDGASTSATPSAATASAASIKSQTISGTISDGGGATINLAGTGTSTVADTAGNFQLSAADGTYTLVPTKAGYTFSPASLSAKVNGASVTSANFVASASSATTYKLSGTVSGALSAGVILTLNGVNVGSAASDASGSYSFSGLASGTYSVSASASGYAFSPALLVTLGNTDSVANDFTDTANGTATLAFSPINPLPQATVGTAYSNTVVGSISGGTAPYHYQTDALSAGTPPLGMVLNPNGNLTGTAQTTGDFSFGVCVVDATGNLVAPCDTTSITVAAAPASSAQTPTPTVSLTASPPSIASGASSTLSWSAANATTCTGSGGALAGALASTGQLVVSPTSTTSYSLICTGDGGSGSASVKISVTAATAPSPSPSVTLSASPSTITVGSSSTLTWTSSQATSCVANGGWSGNQMTTGSVSISPVVSASYTLTCQNASGSSAHATQTITVNAQATAQVPAASSTAWVYYNGQFDWPGSYSYAVSLNYNDTSGAPLSGGTDIQVNVTSQWGGWQPYAQNWDFNSQPYTKLTFALKPTVANQQWQVYFMKVGDIPVGIVVNPSKYGPAPVVGQWATYTIPLADLGVQGLAIYKFCIQDETGLWNNTWYVDNVGFAP